MNNSQEVEITNRLENLKARHVIVEDRYHHLEESYNALVVEFSTKLNKLQMRSYLVDEAERRQIEAEKDRLTKELAKLQNDKTDLLLENSELEVEIASLEFQINRMPPTKE